MADLGTMLDDAIQRAFRPQPIARLETIRILAPLAILGFMSTRVIHADDWLSNAGFRVPVLENDWRQPAAIPGLPVWLAWTLAVTLVVSGLATAAGAFTRVSTAVFAVLLGYVALADRLSAFTVSKIAPVIVLALALGPAGSRWSIDAWRRRRKDPKYEPPTHVSGGCISFFQVMVPIFYCSSGIAKASGDWLSYPYVLYTHLHDSYQTPVSWLAANHMPAFLWTVMQGATLIYELFAPLWFFWRRTRPYALLYGLAMHALIGLMFGPVTWFALLMMSLLVGCFAPATLLDPTLVRDKLPT